MPTYCRVTVEIVGSSLCETPGVVAATSRRCGITSEIS